MADAGPRPVESLLDRVEDLAGAFSGPRCTPTVVGDALRHGFASRDLCAFVSEVVGQLALFTGVAPPTDGAAAWKNAEKAAIAALDFARRLGCPFAAALSPAALNELLPRARLIDYLVGELQACRMVRALASKASPPAAAAAAAAPAADGKSSGSGTAPNVIALGSGEQPFTTQDRLADIARLLGLSGAALSRAENLLDAACNKVLSPAPSEAECRPLLRREDFSAAELAAIRAVNEALATDYAVRREMLIKRLEVTLRSLLWSPLLEGREEAKRRELAPRLVSLGKRRVVSEYLLFAATPALVAFLQSVNARPTSTRVKKALIGGVPDRGGRTERRVDVMPAFRSREPGGEAGTRGRGRGKRGGGRGGDRGGRGARGGGRVQGGWSEKDKGGQGNGGNDDKAQEDDGDDDDDDDNDPTGDDFPASSPRGSWGGKRGRRSRGRGRGRGQG